MQKLARREGLSPLDMPDRRLSRSRKLPSPTHSRPAHPGITTVFHRAGRAHEAEARRFSVRNHNGKPQPAANVITDCRRNDIDRRQLPPV